MLCGSVGEGSFGGEWIHVQAAIPFVAHLKLLTLVNWVYPNTK